MGKHLKNFRITTLLCITAFAAHAQLTENQGWLFISHQQKLTQKFDILGDVQLRSANKFDHLNTLLLRAGLSYNINKKHSVALGYAYKRDWEQLLPGSLQVQENRIYQQYIYNFKYNKTELTFRARLEQRWVNEEQINFSQRARAFISAQIPIIADTAFTTGLYTTLQNELFLNVQNQAKINGKLFDQYRAFGSLGYRWNKHIDTELGYMYWYQKELDNTYRRNILQLMVTTNF